ncbi:glycosyltransferase family A protein [Lactococcus petauri]|uniref:Glycosyltransferase family A protein n=1 Tax=Lactococcus petauri TaxID=1940789 RepID=A0AAJ2IZC8_9LACT|nr:glycosyltransferase family A protein [Lactococcus petauri]QQB45001.1 glycosyltransferase family 2 protein [Lactococcus garvieae]MDC0810730.1 glycosyltransferase family A protein [Lactococcus petauri]MDT2527604.1 glycosyltransferase family A protein [Lactococcus petauri]MDT2542160.1 glycosyltransferase family A protein [Lactococcus petauri]MDT2558747.1 glycosyltransferase family A protein [Lactococcus petauri]
MANPDLPMISVIVPVYNAEQYLAECLDSILGQTYQNLEVILINDGSTDNSLKIIEKYAENDVRIKAFSIENSGPAKCRNFGLEHFSGDYLMFIDSDDYICKDLIENLFSYVKTDSEIAMCKFSKDVHKVGAGDKSLITQTEMFVDSVKQMYSPSFASSGPVCKLYGRKIFDKLRFPTIAMYEDAAISLQALSFASKVSFIDYFGYYYRFNPESITNTKISEKNFAIFDKNRIVLDFVKERHPEAINLARTICLNDNEYVMIESTRVNSDISRIIFNQLFEQNKDLVKNLGFRKFMYLNKKLLYFVMKIMNKVYYNDRIRMLFKKILGV